MKITSTEFNDTVYGSIPTPISTVEVGKHEKGRIVFLGGLNQDPALMQSLQKALAEGYGFSSIGLSAFDTVNPTSEVGEGRMNRRAAILNHLGSTCLRDLFEEPTAVLTHCAGANVFLLAKSQSGRSDYFPDQGVLAEPMIVEGVDLRYYTWPFLKHEKAAKKDDGLISLQSLSKTSTDSFTTTALTKPLLEIIESQGTTLYVNAQNRGERYSIVTGENDFAARCEDIVRSIEALGGLAQVIEYPDQELKGHGYLLVEPKALETVVPLLSVPAFLGELAIPHLA